jgi:hypothetical protein
MTTGTSRVDRFERRTEWPLAVLALVFLAAYAWPILQPDISPAWKHVCTVIDILIWVVFVVEFVARVVLSERRVQYAARHVPDVLMVALPVLRPLRMLRFLVLLRMINRRNRITARADRRLRRRNRWPGTAGLRVGHARSRTAQSAGKHQHVR